MNNRPINRRQVLCLVAGTLLSTVSGCRRRARTKIKRTRHAIQYVHGLDFCTGTISDLDGLPRATWTYVQNGREITQDRPINQETFQLLCNAINNYKVFKKYAVRDPGAKIDPEKFHFVSFTIIQDDRPQIRVFLIPSSESDPEFAGWLKALNCPGAQ